MKIVRWFIVILLVLGLILVRKFETQLFYDPLLDFFHKDFLNLEFPDFDVPKHLISVVFRYLINSLLSLAIIYFIFQKRKFMLLSAVIFAAFLIILIPIYYYFIQTEFQGLFTAGFYVRRLLIQPMLLLILIPGIWYYQRNRPQFQQS